MALLVTCEAEAMAAVSFSVNTKDYFSSIEFHHTGVDLHVKLMSYVFMASSHLHFIVVESSISSLLRP